jgi:hypothetical protein
VRRAARRADLEHQLLTVEQDLARLRAMVDLAGTDFVDHLAKRRRVEERQQSSHARGGGKVVPTAKLQVGGDEWKLRQRIVASVFRVVHGIGDGDTDSVKTAESILAQASLLKCTPEIFSGSPSEGMTPKRVGKMLYKGNMSLRAVERVLPIVVGGMCPANRKKSCNMATFRGYYDGLLIPRMQTPQDTATLTDRARVCSPMTHLKHLLLSKHPTIQASFKDGFSRFDKIGNCITCTVSVDYAKMTNNQGFEIGLTAFPTHMYRYRHSVDACHLVFLGPKKETNVTLAATFQSILSADGRESMNLRRLAETMSTWEAEDTTAEAAEEIEWLCPRLSDEYCPLCESTNSEKAVPSDGKHRTRVEFKYLVDMKAARGGLGIKPGISTQTGEYNKKKSAERDSADALADVSAIVPGIDIAGMSGGAIKNALEQLHLSTKGTNAARRTRLMDAHLKEPATEGSAKVVDKSVFDFDSGSNDSDDDALRSSEPKAGATSSEPPVPHGPWGMPYLARVTMDYLRLRDMYFAGGVGRTDAAFREESGEYKQFCERNPKHTGPCSLLAAGTVMNVPPDTLHGVLQFGELMFRSTFIHLARSQQARGYDPLLAVSRAWFAIQKPFVGNDIVLRQQKKIAEFGGAGSGRVVMRDTTPKAERRKMQYDEKITDDFIARECKTRVDLENELVGIGRKIKSLRALVVGELKADLRKGLLKCLRAGKITRKQLLQGRACNDDDGEWALEIDQSAAQQSASIMTPAEVEEVMKGSMEHISAENYKDIILGGFEPFLEEMNTLARDGGALHSAAVAALAHAVKSTNGVGDELARLQVEITAALAEESEISGLVEGLQTESHRLRVDLAEKIAIATDELAACSSEEKKAGEQLANLKSRVELDQQGAVMKKSWELARAWYGPILTNDKTWTGAKHQEAFDAWDKHFSENFGHSDLAYIVNYRESHKGQMEYCLARYGNELTAANWSTQRTECCGKKIKDEAALLFGFASRGFNNADIIARRRHVRIFHFGETMVKSGTSKCGVCGAVGHNSNNKTFHPTLVAIVE